MTKTLFAGTILRHATAREANGLSPLQNAILGEPRKIRVCSAPTGAGKSYAFQRAVVDRDARVLFVVPTRRLAENLARSMRDDLGAEADRRVMLWTSDERQRQQKNDPKVQVGRLRLRALRGYESPEKGTMTLATPESIAWMLLQPAVQTAGTPRASIVDFLNNLDHIVFDEFHTIDARGMGLCAALSRFTTLTPNGPKITFLSATPIAIRHTLEACGASPDEIVEIRETVITGSADETPGLRAIHGDVMLEIIDAEGPLAALRERMDKARAHLDNGDQVVLIYDSLVALKNERHALGETLATLGVSPQQCLSINSFDDSREGAQDALHAAGQGFDPAGNQFSVLVATSSVEMGVTFRSGMIIMDAGHEPASFLQRAGRAARGEKNGDVVVAASSARRGKSPWLRDLLTRLQPLGPSFSIDSLVDACLHAAREGFDPVPGEQGDDPAYAFRSLPAKAAWSAALFWTALQAGAPSKGARDTLYSFASANARTVGALLRVVAASGPNGEAWRKAMIQEARTLRPIDGCVILRAPSGQCARMSVGTYMHSPNLTQAPSRLSKDGETLEVLLDVELGQIPEIGGGKGEDSIVESLYPHTAARVPFRSRGLVETWLREAQTALRKPRLTETQEKAIEAAIKLVRLTGIVPASRPATQGSGAGSAIL